MFAADIAVAMAEALGHHGGKAAIGRRHPGTGTDCILFWRSGRFRLPALLQRTGSAHHQLAELDDAEIGRTKMLPGAVLDRALAVLDRRVLLADAGDAGEGRRLLLGTV